MGTGQGCIVCALEVLSCILVMLVKRLRVLVKGAVKLAQGVGSSCWQCLFSDAARVLVSRQGGVVGAGQGAVWCASGGFVVAVSACRVLWQSPMLFGVYADVVFSHFTGSYQKEKQTCVSRVPPDTNPADVSRLGQGAGCGGRCHAGLLA